MEHIRKGPCCSFAQLTRAMVLPFCDHLVDDLDVGESPALGLPDLLRVAPTLCDEVVDV